MFRGSSTIVFDIFKYITCVAADTVNLLTVDLFLNHKYDQYIIAIFVIDVAEGSILMMKASIVFRYIARLEICIFLIFLTSMSNNVINMFAFWIKWIFCIT